MIKVNGSDFELKEPVSVLFWLKAQNADINRIVVELNGSLIHRDEYPNVLLKSGDVMEVVTFMGGG